MKAISIITQDSILIGKNYKQFKELFRNSKIESVEKISGKIYNKIKNEYVIKKRDVLTIKGKPTELFDIGVYEII